MTFLLPAEMTRLGKQNTASTQSSTQSQLHISLKNSNVSHLDCLHKNTFTFTTQFFFFCRKNVVSRSESHPRNLGQFWIRAARWWCFWGTGYKRTAHTQVDKTLSGTSHTAPARRKKCCLVSTGLEKNEHCSHECHESSCAVSSIVTILC